MQRVKGYWCGFSMPRRKLADSLVWIACSEWATWSSWSIWPFLPGSCFLLPLLGCMSRDDGIIPCLVNIAELLSTELLVFPVWQDLLKIGGSLLCFWMERCMRAHTQIPFRNTEVLENRHCLIFGSKPFAWWMEVHCHVRSCRDTHRVVLFHWWWRCRFYFLSKHLY